MSNFYKVNIDYIKTNNNWAATFPEIPTPILIGVGTDHTSALAALLATFSTYTQSGVHLPPPFSKY